MKAKRMVSARRRAKRETDGLNALLEDNDEIRRFAYVVIQGLPYVAFSRLSPPIEAGLFKRLRNVALLSEALHLSQHEICGRLGISKETIGKLRRHEHYPMLCGAVRDRVEALSTATNVTSIAKASEGAIGFELLFQALSSAGTREQLTALAELASRSDPKQSRTKPGEKNTLFLPAEIISALAQKISTGTIEVQAEPEKSVSGSVLAVPRLKGQDG